jgi:hypothetical protein
MVDGWFFYGSIIPLLCGRAWTDLIGSNRWSRLLSPSWVSATHIDRVASLLAPFMDGFADIDLHHIDRPIGIRPQQHCFHCSCRMAFQR